MALSESDKQTFCGLWLSDLATLHLPNIAGSSGNFCSQFSPYLSPLRSLDSETWVLHLVLIIFIPAFTEWTQRPQCPKDEEEEVIYNTIYSYLFVLEPDYLYIHCTVESSGSKTASHKARE